MVSTLPTRDEKSFSLFSVVQFPNSECTTAMTNSMLGVCLTAEECSDREGTASGNCASGFGVCCFNSIESLTGTITRNMTYLQNPGFPSAHATTTATTSYAYTLGATADIAQIRLDFHTAILSQPTTASGACGSDVLTTASALGGTGLTLCGVLTGQHVYIESTGAATSANTVTIAVATAATPVANWKILVRMIEKGNPNTLNKPTGCLQWYTGLSGTVSSFNHKNTQGTLGVMNDDSYTVCIRPEGGNTCVAWKEAGGTVDSFVIDATNTNTAAQLTMAAVGTCTMTFLEIPNQSVTSPRYCGGKLATADAGTQPNIVTSDAHYIGVFSGVNAAGRAAAGSGFEISFTQTMC